MGRHGGAEPAPHSLGAHAAAFAAHEQIRRSRDDPALVPFTEPSPCFTGPPAGNGAQFLFSTCLRGGKPLQTSGELLDTLLGAKLCFGEPGEDMLSAALGGGEVSKMFVYAVQAGDDFHGLPVESMPPSVVCCPCAI